MKIIQHVDLQKRFELPCTISDTCPNCGWERTLKNHTLYYPVTNQGIALDFCCDKCRHEWEQWIEIKMEIVDANAVCEKKG